MYKDNYAHKTILKKQFNTANSKYRTVKFQIIDWYTENIKDENAEKEEEMDMSEEGSDGEETHTKDLSEYKIFLFGKDMQREPIL